MTIATKYSVGAMRAAELAITIKSYPAFGGGNRWTLSLAGKGINTYQSQEEAEQAASPLRSLLAELISAETHDRELLKALEKVLCFPKSNIGADWRPVFAQAEAIYRKAKEGR